MFSNCPDGQLVTQVVPLRKYPDLHCVQVETSGAHREHPVFQMSQFTPFVIESDGHEANQVPL